MKLPTIIHALPVAALLLLAVPSTNAVAQEPVTGTVIAGAALAVQIGVEVKNAIEKLGTAVAYAKSKTDGPDADDRAIGYDYDADHGLDWYLDASASATGENDVDDKEETPYTPGNLHWAEIEIHFACTRGVWKPNPVQDNGAGKNQEFWGAVFSWPDDDPGKKDNKTVAAAFAAFSADGKSVDFCYSGSSTDGSNFESVDKRPCPQGNSPSLYETASVDTLPEYTINTACAFLASVEQFRFENAGGDDVRIVPVRPGPIDLVHSYLQQSGSSALFPLLRGKGGTVLQYSRDYYAKRAAEEALALNESPGALADLTIVGAAVELDTLIIVRAGRTNENLMLAYFADASSARVIAPEHAQTGYAPTVLWRSAVTSGQDVSALVGHDYRIPLLGDPDDGLPGKTVFGVMVGVAGAIDDAVLLAVNTPGHWLRDRALNGLPASAPSRGVTAWSAPGASDFDTGELEFHDEDANWIESEANANSGQTANGTNCIFQVDASAYMPGPGDVIGLHGGVAPLPSVTQPGFPMRDDGLYPDALAGDRIYSAMVHFPPGSPRIVHYLFDHNGLLECVGQGDRVAFIDDLLHGDGNPNGPETLPARGIDCCTVTDKPVQHVFAVDMRTATPPPLPGEMIGVLGDHVPLPPSPPGLPLFDNGFGGDVLAGDGIFTGLVSFPPRTPFETEYNYARNGAPECDGHAVRLLVLDDVQSAHFGLSATQTDAEAWMSCASITAVADDVRSAHGVAARLAITGANPFVKSTSLAFELSRPAQVRLRILDARGAQVAVLMDRFAPSGRHAVLWTALDVPAGVYLAQLDAGDARTTQRLVLVR